MKLADELERVAKWLYDDKAIDERKLLEKIVAQLRSMEVEISNFQLANVEARKTINRAHERIAELDPQYTEGGP